MKERGSLHPLKNQELAWSEELPIPTVSYDLSLADEPYIADFDIERYSEYLINNGVNRRRARSLKVTLTKEDEKGPTVFGRYRPFYNTLDVCCGSIWRNNAVISEDSPNEYNPLFISASNKRLAINVSHEAKHIKDRGMFLTYGFLSPTLALGSSLVVSLYGADFVTGNRVVELGISVGFTGLAFIASEKITSYLFLPYKEKRAMEEEKYYLKAAGILTLNPK